MPVTGAYLQIGLVHFKVRIVEITTHFFTEWRIPA